MKGIIVLTLVALLLSVLIVVIDSKLNSKNKEDEIEKLLPGYNCGACGFGSCHGMAWEILKDKEAYKKCRLLKDPTSLIKYLENNK